jgi:hypothetical protein
MKLNEHPIENSHLISDVRTRAMALDFTTRWLVLELAKRYEKAISSGAAEARCCKGCKYYFSYGECRECSHPRMGSDDRDARLYVNDDDFCSYWESK